MLADPHVPFTGGHAQGYTKGFQITSLNTVRVITLLQKNTNNIHEPWCTSTNLRGGNVQGKQIATRSHQTLQKMTEMTRFTHWTDSAFIFRAAESSPVCASHHATAPKMLRQEI